LFLFGLIDAILAKFKRPLGKPQASTIAFLGRCARINHPVFDAIFGLSHNKVRRRGEVNRARR